MTSSGPGLKLKPSGDLMPLVGWKVGKETTADTIVTAVKAGYRLFDCAQDYGNEKECGEGIRRVIEQGLATREELFITTKVWNTFHARQHAIASIKRSLEDWGLDYFNLVLIHFPIALEYVDPKVRHPPGWTQDGTMKGELRFAKVPLQETWEALEEALTQGLTRNIGMSNTPAAVLIDLLTYAKVHPSVLQIEHHPYLVQQDLVQFCKDTDIAVTAYSSFGPASFIEIGFENAIDCPSLFDHGTIRAIAAKHGKTPAQVLLRWATQRGIAVIPKSNNPQRIKQNLEINSFLLDDEEIKEISGLDRGLRFCDPGSFLLHKVWLFR